MEECWSLPLWHMRVFACPSEFILRGQSRPRPPSMSGADGAGLDPPGLDLALCPVAPGVSLQRVEKEHETPVQALPPQTGKSLESKDKQTQPLQKSLSQASSRKWYCTPKCISLILHSYLSFLSSACGVSVVPDGNSGLGNHVRSGFWSKQRSFLNSEECWCVLR